jgi:lipopolysaccharide export system permease protein
MPWTLYRHIFFELLKLLVLSTFILMVVIGFGAAIPPLTEGLLDATSLVKFVMFSMPTMLGFALPFGAVFAATMVFSRMAADNEIIACRASGMSYLTILLPVVFLGLVLWIGLFFLSNWVIPSFYERAERQLESDMTEVMISHIEKRQPMKFRRDLVLYADGVSNADIKTDAINKDGEQRPIRVEKAIELRGVTVSRFGKEGELMWEGAAQNAIVLLFRFINENQTWVGIQLRRVVVYDVTGSGGSPIGERGGAGQVWQNESLQLPLLRMPNPFRDRLEFLSWPELKERGERPELFDDVKEKKARLAQAMATEDMLGVISKALTAPGSTGMQLTDPRPGHVNRLTAPTVSRQNNRLLLEATAGRRVRVDHFVDGVLMRRWDAKSAELSIELRETDAEPHVALTLREVIVSDAQALDRTTEAKTIELPGSYLSMEVLSAMTKQSIGELRATADAQYADAAAVRSAGQSLDREIQKLGQKIRSRLHARGAAAVGVLLVFVFAAVLSIRMQGTMPLVVYFWSFLVTAVAVIITRSGENIAAASRGIGGAEMSIIWLGNVIVVAAIVSVYWRLSRN